MRSQKSTIEGSQLRGDAIVGGYVTTPNTDQIHSGAADCRRNPTAHEFDPGAFLTHQANHITVIPWGPLFLKADPTPPPVCGGGLAKPGASSLYPGPGTPPPHRASNFFPPSYRRKKNHR